VIGSSITPLQNLHLDDFFPESSGLTAVGHKDVDMSTAHLAAFVSNPVSAGIRASAAYPDARAERQYGRICRHGAGARSSAFISTNHIAGDQ
jgi:hypothetical protein